MSWNERHPRCRSFHDTNAQFSGYAVTLADDANHLAKVGHRVTDVPTLWGFEVIQAAASLNPIRTLASSVDAATPAPGIPLVFRRVFGQPIIFPYQPGPLGRGWSHNWDISIQLLSNGDVLLHGPLGADRFFTRNSNGSYSPLPGDNGALILSGGADRLTETDKTIWQFRADQLLDYVQDANNIRITCAYTGGLLTALTHSSASNCSCNTTARITSPASPIPSAPVRRTTA